MKWETMGHIVKFRCPSVTHYILDICVYIWTVFIIPFFPIIIHFSRLTKCSDRITALVHELLLHMRSYNYLMHINGDTRILGVLILSSIIVSPLLAKEKRAVLENMACLILKHSINSCFLKLSIYRFFQYIQVTKH